MPDPLLEAVTRYTNARGRQNLFTTAIPGFTILRADQPKPPAHRIFKPALCLVVQGAKWTAFGHQRFDYRAGQALVVSLEMPAHGCVVEATPAKPYLSVVIEFDLATMREVIEGLGRLARPRGAIGGSVFVSASAGPLADCVLRMVRLLGTPRAMAMLYPSFQRELCYWLLAGPQGGDIARIVLANGPDRRLLNAIHTLRERFAAPVRIEELAEIAMMSPSAFHRQFKALTSMTPLKYQKRLRLLEARNLMITAATTAETAAFRVGYASPSQFSREYTRMFGAPPRRDASQLPSPLRLAPKPPPPLPRRPSARRQPLTPLAARARTKIAS